MTEESDGSGSLAGLSIDEATDAVMERESMQGVDRGLVRETLAVVAEDGVVGEAGVESALADASKVVATPETRIELAEDAMADADEKADPVRDLDTVRDRLVSLKARLKRLDNRIDELGEDLSSAVSQTGEDEEDLFAVAREIRRITEDANECQREADELIDDIESFEEWLTDPATRIEELATDVDAIEERVAEVEASVDRLPADGDEESEGDPATVWFEASVQHRVTELLIADARSELADDRRLTDDDRLAELVDRFEHIEKRLDDLEERAGAAADRLDDRARPAWTERYGGYLSEMDDEFGAFEPPIDWGAVEAMIERHRTEIRRLEASG
ncbi:MAG: halo transducer protein [Haloarculaceae archaeon]